MADQTIIDWQKRRGERFHTREVATLSTLEKLPQHYIEKVDFIVKQLEALQSRLEAVEARPHLSENSVRELMEGLNTRFKTVIEQQVAAATGDIRSDIAVLKGREAGQPPSGQADQITKLAGVVKGFGEYVRSLEDAVEQRHIDMERRYAAIAEHLSSTKDEAAEIRSFVYRIAEAVHPDHRRIEGS